MIIRMTQLLMLALVLTSCLKTRSDVSEQEQNAIYGKKNIENQLEVQSNSAGVATLDEKDELIRNLNGRVETLENQLAALQKEKESSASLDSQKIILLQEGLAKLETQVQKLDSELVAAKFNDKNLTSSDEGSDSKSDITEKKQNAYALALQYFSKQDWKKAILNFQKYTDETPKGKNIADAKYKIGVCFQELGMKDEAMAFYEEVVANHSKSEAGKKSKARLTKLKK